MHLISKGCTLAKFSQFSREIGSFLPFCGNFWGARAPSAPSLTAPLLGKALQSSIRSTRLDEVASIIEFGANVNETYETGFTPLSLAASMGLADIVSLLIDSGSGINIFDGHGNTPLTTALLRDKEEVAELLIAKGANICQIDHVGNSPLNLIADRYG